MADTLVQKNCGSQHLMCKANVKSAIFCENCVTLENQLYSAQEELNSAKLIINLLLKDIESTEVSAHIDTDNLDKCDRITNSEIIHNKISTWSEVVNGTKKSDSYIWHIESRHNPVIVNRYELLSNLKEPDSGTAASAKEWTI